MTVAVMMRGRLSVAEDRAVYLCELRNGRYVRLSQGAYDLFTSVQSGASFDELAAIARRSRADVEARDIEAAYRAIVDKLERAERRETPKRAGFWLTFTLMPARWVARIGRPFAYAYHPLIAAALLVLISIGGVLAVTHDAIATTIVPAHFGSGYLLFVASLVAHEVGHAAACLRHGAQPRSIGATMYLMYPALFTDVSAAWTLRRWQRVVVDLGGTYFQLIVASGFAIGYVAVGWEPLRIALLLIGGACVLSLNPVLRFDGYWVVADALGISNLGDVPARLGAAIWAKMRGRQARALPWSWTTLGLLGIYTAATMVFWAYFLGFLVGGVGDAIASYPARLDDVWTPLVDGRIPGLAILALLSTTFMLAFVAMIAHRLVSLIRRLAVSLLRRR